jgi:hypothetical protein
MRKASSVLLTIVFFAISSLAAKKFPMTAATIVPGARGVVEIDKDKNGNTRVNMEVQFLANPESLTPPASVYVVWLLQKDGSPENQGQLKVDKKLKANFKTVTPVKSFDLFVTAERDSTIKVPNGAEVLRATIQP